MREIITVSIPSHIVQQIDQLVGPRKRSIFIRQAINVYLQQVMNGQVNANNTTNTTINDSSNAATPLAGSKSQSDTNLDDNTKKQEESLQLSKDTAKPQDIAKSTTPKQEHLDSPTQTSKTSAKNTHNETIDNINQQLVQVKKQRQNNISTNSTNKQDQENIDDTNPKHDHVKSKEKATKPKSTTGSTNMLEDKLWLRASINELRKSLNI